MMTTNRLLFALLISLLIFVNGNAQIGNAKELLNFAKTEYSTKNKNLIVNGWILSKSENNKTDARGVEISKSYYKKTINLNKYELLIEKKTYPDSKITNLWTTLTISNGTTFDELVDGIEKLGYPFKLISKGKSFAGSMEQNFLITSEIKNFEGNPSDWYYEIKIVYKPT